MVSDLFPRLVVANSSASPVCKTESVPRRDAMTDSNRSVSGQLFWNRCHHRQVFKLPLSSSDIPKYNLRGIRTRPMVKKEAAIVRGQKNIFLYGLRVELAALTE